MEKIIFIRYGEHTNGHLNDQGRETMRMVAGKLKPIIQDSMASIVCAKVIRAEEGAAELSRIMNLQTPISFDEFYSAEEDGKLPNIPTAATLINNLGEGVDSLIVVASREYIEQLPSYILMSENNEVTNLDRGEILVIDLENRTVNKI